MYGEGRLGLLAGVFGDGIVRVLDVREEWIGSEDGTVNLSVTEGAWEFDFGKEVMATCIAWKSNTEIVVGCSNGVQPFSVNLIVGFVAIFDLRDETDDRTPTSGMNVNRRRNSQFLYSRLGYLYPFCSFSCPVTSTFHRCQFI